MAAITVKLAASNALDLETTPGQVMINFDDGSGWGPYENTGDFLNWLISRLPDQDQARCMLVAQRLAVDPLMDSPALWNGKSLTIDLEQANPASVFRII